MNAFVFGIGLVVVALLLINVSPVITESIQNIDAQNPDIDDNAINLASTFPFFLFVVIIGLLVFYWWRGGLD